MILRERSPLATAVATSAIFLNLPGQVARHGVDGVGQVFPGSRDTRHLRLPSQFSVRANFAGDASYFRGKNAELLDHGVNDCGGPEKFPFEWPAIHVQSNGLRQISLRHGCNRPRDFRVRLQQVVDESIDGYFHLAPGAARLVKLRSLARFAFLPDHLADASQFVGDLLVRRHNLVKRIRKFSWKTCPGSREADGKVAIAHGLQAGK